MISREGQILSIQYQLSYPRDVLHDASQGTDYWCWENGRKLRQVGMYWFEQYTMHIPSCLRKPLGLRGCTIQYISPFDIVCLYNVFHASWGKFDGKAIWTYNAYSLLISLQHLFHPLSVFLCFSPFSCWMEAAARLTLIYPLSSTFAESTALWAHLQLCNISQKEYKLLSLLECAPVHVYSFGSRNY